VRNSTAQEVEANGLSTTTTAEVAAPVLNDHLMGRRDGWAGSLQPVES
jgi:hypothetical protein